MGYYDEKGFIYIVDRKKDMIITGGENVYPREVRGTLPSPDRLECAVIGVPDEKWVERVCMRLIVLREGQEGASDGIIAFSGGDTSPGTKRQGP